jgi:excisionase family DNA binding protein
MASTEDPGNSGCEPRIGRSVSLDHAAALLGVSRRTIYNRIREGRLQTIRTLGGSQRVLLDSVNENRPRAAGYAEAAPLGDRRHTLGGGSSA